LAGLAFAWAPVETAGTIRAISTGALAGIEIAAGEIRTISTWTLEALSAGALSAGTLAAEIAAIKGRAHFFAGEFAVFIFVQLGQCGGGVLEFRGGNLAVFIGVQRGHHRVHRASAAEFGPTVLATLAGPSAFTGASACAGPTACVALSWTPATTLRAEEFLHFLAGGTFVLIEPAVAVLVEFLQHSGAHSFAVKTTPATAFTWASTGSAFTTTWASTGSAFTATWASTGSTFTATWASTGSAFTATWASTGGSSSSELGAEKFLQLFTRGPLFFIELAIAVLVEFLDHGFPDSFTRVCSATATFATTATLSRAILGLCSQTECY
jgi:hypothetical protein